MKVNQKNRRFWQFIILAISVLTCASWSQAADLQKNIKSVPQKNIMDHAKLRQASLHPTDKWVVCNAYGLKSLEANSGKDVGIPSLLNGDSSSNDQIDMATQNCNGTIHFTKLSQPSQKTSIVVGTPVFCQDTRDVTDVLQGQGYFSGFTKPLEAVDSKNILGQAASEPTSELPVNLFKTSTLSAEEVLGDVACGFAGCSSDADDAVSVSLTTANDANDSNIDDSFNDVIVLAVASGCSVK